MVMVVVLCIFNICLHLLD